MFNTTDHPDWVSKFELGLADSSFEDCIVEDCELWSHVREFKKEPHIANEWMGMLFNRIHLTMFELYGEVFKISYEVNAMASSLSIDDRNITTSKEFFDAIKGQDNNIVYFNENDKSGNVIAEVYQTGDKDHVVITVEKQKDKSVLFYIQDHNEEHPKIKIDTPVELDGVPSEEFLRMYDFRHEYNDYEVNNLEQVKSVMLRHADDKQLIRYLMVGVENNGKFNGFVYDYTGGGEHTEYVFENGVMIEDDEACIENSFSKEFTNKIQAHMDDQLIRINEIGEYTYEGNEELNCLLHSVEDDNEKLTPIEVGNTIIIED